MRRAHPFLLYMEVQIMNYLEIVDIQGREILDSRGNPTVEAEITLADGTAAHGAGMDAAI